MNLPPFENACRRAGLKIRFHDLRHTFATELIEKGVDIVTVRSLLGHHSVSVTQRYTHPCDERKKQALELLSRTEQTEEKEIDLSHSRHTKKEPHSELFRTSLFSVN